MTTFFSYNALQSQRASGYKSTMHALAELIDNSFDANASTVRVVFLEKQENNRKHITEILVCDDGEGMSTDILQDALQFGNTTNVDLEEMIRSKKKGKFGYGLPNASLSQCPCVRAYSWRKKDEFFSTYLDLDELGKTKSIEIPEVTGQDIPPHYGPVGAVMEPRHGTIISWQRCDRLSNTRSSTIVEKSSQLLGRLFRYLLGQNRQIVFAQFLYNSVRAKYEPTAPEVFVRPNDPLFLMSNTFIADKLWQEASRVMAGVPDNRNIPKHYAAFAESETKCKPTNIRMDDLCLTYPFSWRGKQYKFELVVSCADIRIQKPGTREGGSTEVGKFYGDKARDGNISFVRADREIATGHFGFYAVTEPRHRWWSMEIRFDADADDLLGLHNNKQGIEFTATPKLDVTDQWDEYSAELLQAKEKLWLDLTVRIQGAQKAAFKHIREQHKAWDEVNEIVSGPGDTGQLPSGTPLTNNTIVETDGKRNAQFTQTQKQQLLERLKERYPQISPDDIEKAILNYDQSRVRGCVLYADSESQQLWSFTTVYDFLVILINTRHEFYQNALHPLRLARAEEALAAIELFISSLASEEQTHFSRDPEAQTLEDFRTYVGVHLNRYMRRVIITEESLRYPQSKETNDNSEAVE